MGADKNSSRRRKLDPASKFTKIHNSHASYVKIQHHHLTRRKCISQGVIQQHPKNSWTRNAKIHGQGGMQKFMDKGECKNFLVTIHNLSPHSFISKKFPPALITCSIRNVAILLRTSASNDLSRGHTSSPNLWI
jgi:hypothetical protein